MKPENRNSEAKASETPSCENSELRPYEAPVILSIEPLEAVAATCPPADINPPVAVGKPSGGWVCGTPGS